jgi:hypothetical protein
MTPQERYSEYVRPWAVGILFAIGFMLGNICKCQEIEHGTDVWIGHSSGGGSSSDSGSPSRYFTLPEEPRGIVRAATSQVQGAAARQVRVSRIDLALDALVIASQVLDYTSTEDCISKPYRVCHEAQLPTALVANKPAFAALKGSEAALEIWGMHRLEKRHPGMRTMARVAQVVNVGLVLGTDGHNYVLAGGKK